MRAALANNVFGKPLYVNDQGKPKDDGVTGIVSATDPNHTGNSQRDIKFYREQDADLIAADEHVNPDQFIAKAAACVLAHPDPDLRITPEFSNEYRTSIFDQYAYFLAGGVANYPGATFSAGNSMGPRPRIWRIFSRLNSGRGQRNFSRS